MDAVDKNIGRFQINTHYLGDSLELLKELPNNSVPLILTDIPYGVVNRESAGIRVFDKKAADVCSFEISDLVSELERVSSGSIYVFCSTEQVSELRKGFADKGMTTRLCIWEKTNPSPVNCQYMWMSGIECCVYARKRSAVFNEHYKNCVWRFPNGRSKRHPTEKPLNLFEYLVKTSSNPGDLVLDPFLGSGTTSEAAIKNGRSYIGFELTPEYFEVANERLKKFPK